MNSEHNTTMTTAEAMTKLFEMWQATTNHFSQQGLTGESLEAAVSGFLIERANQ